MFTGFASENTPAVQVRDCSRFPASVGGNQSISLADDCAPIQFFKTGVISDLDINVYMPTAPVEGKSITIINAAFSNQKQAVAVYAAESFYGTAVLLFRIGPGQKVEFVYSDASVSTVPGSGGFPTRWISLDIAHKAGVNSGSSISGGSNNGARGTNSFVGGGGNNNTTTDNAAVVGGGSNTGSGANTFVGGGSSNTASGTNAAVIGGTSNTASQTNTVVVGGSSNTANTGGASVTGGQFNIASGTVSAVLGGSNNSANAERAVVIGGGVGSARSIIGNFVASASAFPIGGQNGVQQLATLLLGRQTTDATATRLASNSSAAATTNQVILPNNSAYAFEGTCIANVTAGGDTSGWKFEGAIKRGANAASTTLVAAVTPTVIAQDAGAATWVLAITADTTNGGIAVTVTGAAATTIRWVCKIETTEVTF